MEIDNQPEEPKQQITVGKSARRHWATWLLAALLILSLAGNGFLYMQFDKTKKDLSAQRAQAQHFKDEAKELKSRLGGEAAIGENEEIGDKTTACTYTPSASLKDNIRAALDTQNTAAFATYVTDPVKYVLAASELGGDQTPDGAATQLTYTHSATAPWDFNLPAATIAGYDSGFYTDYFGANTLVGKAASGMVVAFDFNCDGSKISNIFVAADDDLL